MFSNSSNSLKRMAPRSSMRRNEDSHLRKLFIGGLSSYTCEKTLKAFYAQWGTVVNVSINRDPLTGQSRCFGFISYLDESMVDDAQAARPHIIDGKTVSPKRALPRPEFDKYVGVSTIKIFVGGLHDGHDEVSLREHFSRFGNVIDVKMLFDKKSGRKRGFAYVKFDDYDAVDKAILQKHHTINFTLVDVKKSTYKQELEKKLALRRQPSYVEDISHNQDIPHTVVNYNSSITELSYDSNNSCEKYSSFHYATQQNPADCTWQTYSTNNWSQNLYDNSNIAYTNPTSLYPTNTTAPYGLTEPTYDMYFPLTIENPSNLLYTSESTPNLALTQSYTIEENMNRSNVGEINPATDVPTEVVNENEGNQNALSHNSYEKSPNMMPAEGTDYSLNVDYQTDHTKNLEHTQNFIPSIETHWAGNSYCQFNSKTWGNVDNVVASLGSDAKHIGWHNEQATKLSNELPHFRPNNSYRARNMNATSNYINSRGRNFAQIRNSAWKSANTTIVNGNAYAPSKARKFVRRFNPNEASPYASNGFHGTMN